MNKYLEHLIKDPLVYYVYQRGSYIYNLNTSESDIDYLVIVDANYQVPKEFKKYKVGKSFGNIRYNVQIDNYDFCFFEMQEWFKKVLDCHLDAWECACLDKKFIKKEHVKLLMETNPLKLREYFNSQYKLYMGIAEDLLARGEYVKAEKYLWYIIKDVKFINQILTNHKIVNYKEANEERIILSECEPSSTAIRSTFLSLIEMPLKYLKDNTDNILKKKKIEEFKKKNNA